MKLQGDGVHFDIYDSIKSVADAQTLVDAFEKSHKDGHKELIIKIHDSKTIPSNVIGCLLKLGNNGVNIKIYIRDNNLYEIVEFLCLSDMIEINRLY